MSVWVDGVGEVAAHQPDLLLEPASNQKILVALAANNQLDLDSRLKTRFEQVGTDLVIRLAADPSLSLGRLGVALDAVAASNTTFERVVVDVSAFPQGPRADDWLDWQIPRHVGPLSSFMIDNNRWSQSGEMVSDPDRANGNLVVEQLGRRGVQIDDLVIVTDTADAPPPGLIVATVESPPIGELIETMLVDSDNQHADLLLMQLGRQASGQGSLASGADAINTLLDDRCISSEGAIDDGSGLSRGNRRSARGLVEAMVSVHGTPEGELLRSQFPVGGVSGTLSNRFGGSYTGKVQAKTGTIFGGRALSGWAQTASGPDAIFSIIVNGERDAASASLGAMDALVRTIVDS